jgi:hypothetical protein
MAWIFSGKRSDCLRCSHCSHLGFYFIPLGINGDKYKKEIEKGRKEGKRENFSSVKAGFILVSILQVKSECRTLSSTINSLASLSLAASLTRIGAWNQTLEDVAIAGACGPMASAA